MARNPRRDLARRLEREGFLVKQTKSGYLVWRAGAPHRRVGFHASKGSDHRALKNIYADLKRVLEWTP